MKGMGIVLSLIDFLFALYSAFRWHILALILRRNELRNLAGP
jgi:hypothetical protein